MIFLSIFSINYRAYNRFYRGVSNDLKESLLEKVDNRLCIVLSNRNNYTLYLMKNKQKHKKTAVPHSCFYRLFNSHTFASAYPHP